MTGVKAKPTANRRRNAEPMRAEIAAGDGGLILWVNDVLTKNERYRAGRRGKHATILLSDRAVEFREAVESAAGRASLPCPAIDSGIWRLTVLACWPTQRHLDLSVANGDADAAISAVMDALQHAEVVDNDVRFVDARGFSVHRPGRRTTVAHVTPTTGAEHDGHVAHLFGYIGGAL